MSRPNVYVTRMIPEAAIEKLKAHCDVEISPYDALLPRAEFLEKIKGRDAVLCMLTDIVDAEAIAAAAPQCRIFANYAVGYNNIDVDACTKAGIIASNTPEVLTNSTADIAWALVFSVCRRIVESDKFMRAGRYKGWGPLLLLGQDITGKTLGVIGAGRIGAAFARKSIGFDMKILYTDIARNEKFEAETGATFVDQETLLKEADIISLHTPLMPSTHHLISDHEFSLMKPTAVLVNSSRGPIIDEKALVRALKEKRIFGAGLDVTENEPDFEPELADLDNVVILPHIASATIETRTAMGMITVDNIIAACCTGELPPTCLNPAVWDAKS